MAQLEALELLDTVQKVLAQNQKKDTERATPGRDGEQPAAGSDFPGLVLRGISLKLVVNIIGSIRDQPMLTQVSCLLSVGKRGTG